MLSLPTPNADLQEIMFNELHHRFYNSLQIVSSAISSVESGAQGVGKVEQLRNRIALLGGLHRRLAMSITDVADMRAAFAEVCICLTEGFALGRVKLELAGMALPAHPSVVRGLTLIMVELVTNALKYSAIDQGCVCVVVTSVRDRHELTVTSGATPDQSANGRTPALAARLVNALGGTIAVTSAAKHVVRVNIPTQHMGGLASGGSA